MWYLKIFNLKYALYIGIVLALGVSVYMLHTKPLQEAHKENEAQKQTISTLETQKENLSVGLEACKAENGALLFERYIKENIPKESDYENIDVNISNLVF